MGNASKRVLGNFLDRGDLALSNELRFAFMSQPLRQEISADGGRQATLMGKSTVSELSRLRGK
jgi:hypothetical protein